MEKIHNKLVRDKIPEIIEQEGGKLKARILEKQEYLDELFKKLEEEVREVAGARENKQELTKEIGDVYEVIDAIIENCGLDREEIMKLKEQRKVARGGFNKKIFLESEDD